MLDKGFLLLLQKLIGIFNGKGELSAINLPLNSVHSLMRCLFSQISVQLAPCKATNS